MAASSFLAGPKPFITAFFTITAVSIAFFVATLVIRGPFLFGPAYWLLWAAYWSVLGIFGIIPWYRTANAGEETKFKLGDGYVTDDIDVSIRDFILSSWGTLFSALVAAVCSLVSFGGVLAARGPEKPTAVACLIALAAVALFVLAKYKTYTSTNGLTLSRVMRNSNRNTFNFVVLPFFGFVGGLVVFLTITSAYQAVSLGSDNLKYPPPGELLPVGGSYSHKLHVYCTGEKKNPSDPIVWFEHGLGGQSADFSWVQQDVATYARACSYDHSGLGYSEVGPFPRTTERIVDELDNLLRTNNITGDLMMVGHSMAGLNTRYASRKLTANKVVGLVLVDPVSYKDYSNCVVGATGRSEGLYALGININTWGLVRLLSLTSAFPQIKNIRSLPDFFSPRYLSNLFLTSNQVTRTSEGFNFPSSCGQTKELLNTPRANGTVDDSLGNLPFGLVVCYKSDAVESKTLFNVSTDQITINATDSAHVSILHRPEEVKSVIQLTRQVFSKVVKRTI
ncbi:hypothetical protein HDU96_001997 [Phlyctochytrium bullatum]|nr:hypothetical protein HDU96_001997 [Phlyctochytrium bullatum]